MYIKWILQSQKKRLNAINLPRCQVEKTKKTAYYAMELLKSTKQKIKRGE